MANLKNRATPATKRQRILRVSAPRDATVEHMERFTDQINVQLTHIAEQLDRIPPALSTDFDPDEFVRNVQFKQKLDDALADVDAEQTTEGSDARSGRATSRRRRALENIAERAILNAVPTVAPPEVSPTASSVGTTTDPPLFALSDHTHADARTAPYTLQSSLTVPTGFFSLYAHHRIVTSTNRITLQGTARMTGV